MVDMEISLDAESCTQTLTNGATRSFSVSSADLLKHFVPAAKDPLSLISPALRWISCAGNTVVFERPPCAVSVLCTAGHFYELNLPWQIYILRQTIWQIEMYFSSTSLSSFKQNLVPAPLPNFYPSGKLCAGKGPLLHTEELLASDASLGNMFSIVLDLVWNNSFNNDILPTLPEELNIPGEVCSFLTHLTKISPEELATVLFPSQEQYKFEDLIPLNSNFSTAFKGAFLSLQVRANFDPSPEFELVEDDDYDEDPDEPDDYDYDHEPEEDEELDDAHQQLFAPATAELDLPHAACNPHTLIPVYNYPDSYNYSSIIINTTTTNASYDGLLYNVDLEPPSEAVDPRNNILPQ